MIFWLKQIIKMLFQQLILPAVYNVNAMKPVIPGTVILADAHHSEIPFSMLAIHEELLAHPELQITEMYWNNNSDSPLKVFQNMASFMKKYASAETVIICDNFLPAASCKKRSETQVIQLWHACGAFKKFGYDTEADIPSYYIGNVMANCNIATVSSEICVKPFASAMKLPEDRILPVGVSRTDMYFNNSFNQHCREQFFRQHPEAQDKKIVLWAPTFRGKPGSAQVCGLEDVLKAQERLRDTHYFIIKLHPHSQLHTQGTNCSIPSEELLPVADVVITDYSSILFDAMIYKLPIILFAPDLKEYVDNRGFYLDYFTLPGILVRDSEHIVQTLSDEAALDASIDQHYFEFFEQYMAACDGHSTQRIIDYITKPQNN